MSAPLFISIKEAARLLSLSTRTIYRRVADGTLPPPVKIGRAVRFRQLDLENYNGVYTVQENRPRREAG